MNHPHTAPQTLGTPPHPRSSQTALQNHTHTHQTKTITFSHTHSYTHTPRIQCRWSRGYRHRQVGFAQTHPGQTRRPEPLTHTHLGVGEGGFHAAWPGAEAEGAHREVATSPVQSTPISHHVHPQGHPLPERRACPLRTLRSGDPGPASPPPAPLTGAPTGCLGPRSEEGGPCVLPR